MNKEKLLKLRFAIIILAIFSYLFICPVKVRASDKTLIFPLPQEIKFTDSHFEFDDNTRILVPQYATENDMRLAYLLVSELSDRYGVAIKVEHSTKLEAAGNFIIMGNIDNPLIKNYCLENNIEVTNKSPGKEGYVLTVSNNAIVVSGWDDSGAFYGLQSLRQLLKKEGKNVFASGVKVRDWPNMPFRGIKVFAPGKESLPFFERFLKDFMALYKYNKLILEVNAVMRLDRHPELNAGSVEFGEELIYSRRERPVGPNKEYQNSTHHDAGDGGILEKREVAGIVEFANEQHIEVIPEITSLTHSYYLLSRHRELAEIKDAEWPDTYCPSNPKSYELLFDVMDEYIEVMNPRMVMIGHDEWRMPVDVCPLCKGKDYTELFAMDVNNVYNYLSRKNIKVSMWGDHLLESVRDKGIRKGADYKIKYDRPGALSPKQVKDLIPKDILIFNWFHAEQKNDSTLEELGFDQVYGNMLPSMRKWEERIKLPGVMGGAPSSWAATTEFNFGKDLLGDFLGCANLLWSKEQSHEPEEHFRTVQYLMPSVHRNLDGIKYPSETGDPVTSFRIDSYFNKASVKELFEVDLSTLKNGRVGTGKKIFDLAELASGKYAVIVGTQGEKKISIPSEVKNITINEDVSSLIFLHACAKGANNEKAYRYIYNFDDTSDLLGWYEVVYEDGYTETIPIRYGYNILEWNVVDKYDEWHNSGRGQEYSQRYCYRADAVDCSSNMQKNPINFFAFEWVNTRFGKKIKEINLKGTSNFINPQGKIMESNAVMLIGLSVVKKREVPVIKPLK